jgi:hypothetical protein
VAISQDGGSFSLLSELNSMARLLAAFGRLQGNDKKVKLFYQNGSAGWE